MPLKGFFLCFSLCVFVCVYVSIKQSNLVSIKTLTNSCFYLNVHSHIYIHTSTCACMCVYLRCMYLHFLVATTKRSADCISTAYKRQSTTQLIHQLCSPQHICKYVCVYVCCYIAINLQQNPLVVHSFASSNVTLSI